MVVPGGREGAVLGRAAVEAYLPDDSESVNRLKARPSVGQGLQSVLVHSFARALMRRPRTDNASL